MSSDKTIRVLAEMVRGTISSRFSLVRYLDAEYGKGSGALLLDEYEQYFNGDTIALPRVCESILTRGVMPSSSEVAEIVFRETVNDPKAFVRSCLPLLQELAKLEDEDGRLEDTSWFVRRIPETRTRVLFLHLLDRYGIIGPEGIIYRQNMHARTRAETVDVPFADLLRTYDLLNEWSGVRHTAEEVPKRGRKPGRRIIVGTGQRMPGPAETVPTVTGVKTEKVLWAATDYYGVTYEQFCSESREKPLAHHRQVLMYLLYECAGMSFPEIGRFLGHRNHTTVIHGHRKVKEALPTDSEVQTAVREIVKRFTTTPVEKVGITETTPPSTSPVPTTPATPPPVTILLEQWVAVNARDARGLLNGFKTGNERRVSNVQGRFGQSLVAVLRRLGYLVSAWKPRNGTEVRLWKFQSTHFAVFPDTYTIKQSLRHGLLAPAKRTEVPVSYWLENIRQQLEALNALEVEDEMTESIETPPDEAATAVPVEIHVETTPEPVALPQAAVMPETAEVPPEVDIEPQPQDTQESEPKEKPDQEEPTIQNVPQETVDLVYRFNLSLDEARSVLACFPTGEDTDVYRPLEQLGWRLYSAFNREGYVDCGVAGGKVRFVGWRLKETLFRVHDRRETLEGYARKGFVWPHQERSVDGTFWLENIRRQVAALDGSTPVQPPEQSEAGRTLKYVFNLHLDEAERMLDVFRTGDEQHVLRADKRLGGTLYVTLKKYGYTTQSTGNTWGKGTPFRTDKLSETCFQVHTGQPYFDGIRRYHELVVGERVPVGPGEWLEYLKKHVQRARRSSATEAVKTAIAVERALIDDKQRQVERLNAEIAGHERQLATLLQEVEERDEEADASPTTHPQEEG